jgi:phosphoglycerate dehydrogenase-like enzyme
VSRPRVLVVVDPDPDASPPPLHLVDVDVELLCVGPEPTDDELAGAEAVCVWDFRFGALGPLLARADAVRWVHAASVGVNRLLCPELDGVTLTNSRGVFDRAIAEWVVGVVLAHVKGLAETWRHQQSRTWQYRMTGRLAGRRVAVVGTGSIGRACADLLRRLDAEVTLVARTRRTDPDYGALPGCDELAAVAAGVDLLVLAVPLTPDTTALVDAGVLGALGPHGYLVNVGRGPTVVEADLIAAVRDGVIAGAALDVFDVEPLPADSPLWTLPGVLVSPHISGEYVGFEEQLMAVFADNLRRWRDGEVLANVVDPAVGYVPAVRP